MSTLRPPISLLRPLVAFAVLAALVAAHGVATRSVSERSTTVGASVAGGKPVTSLRSARTGRLSSSPTGRRAAARKAAADRRAALLRDARLSRGTTEAGLELPTPNDPLWPDAWALRAVEAQRAWSLGTGSAEVVVAVIDTGVDRSHPDLAGALVPGWDFVGDDDDPSDDHGHGTAVAGVIAARSNNGVGVVSTCWSCSIMPIKVVDSSGSGTSDDVAAGILWAVEHGAHVINLSLVLAGDDPAVAGAVAHAAARGAVVVAAAGNAGGEGETYPASYPGVLSVAGEDAGTAVYDWSTRGGWVSVAAPGCSLTTNLGGGFGEFCGTSSAAAAASGVAALARSAAGSDGLRVAEALRSTAVPRPFVAHGRIDAYATMQRLTAAAS